MGARERRKIRGSRKPNEFPIITEMDAEKVLSTAVITRRIIISKIAEFYDPYGFWEPIKVQMKLEMLPLQGKDWDEVLSEEDQVKWKNVLKTFVSLTNISIPRCCVPECFNPNSKIRMICLADAAEHAGDAAVYVGRRISPENWSCSLIAAKSRLMNGTIPRNTLSAILLCTELAYMVKGALKDLVDEVIYVCHRFNHSPQLV